MPLAGSRGGAPRLVGTAGWAIPKVFSSEFSAEGTNLSRYAQVFPVAEINSSFHRPHRPSTYARWAASVPDGFLFSVKTPKEITHTRKLVDVAGVLERFLEESAGLGDRRGPLLVQLPPRFAYDEGVVCRFWEVLRARFAGEVVCEPRHESWFCDAVDAALERVGVARVAADPARVARAAEPGGWRGLAYWRLHGAPRVYYSAYAAERLDGVAAAMRVAVGTAWCIFDNTASGAATGDALGLRAILARASVWARPGSGVS